MTWLKSTPNSLATLRTEGEACALPLLVEVAAGAAGTGAGFTEAGGVGAAFSGTATGVSTTAGAASTVAPLVFFHILT